MDLRRLQCLFAVAEARHFIRAADRLHIAQSLLFRMSRDWEQDLGVTLFERGAGIGTNLTPAGQPLAECGPRVFRLVDQAQSATLAAAAGSLATVRVARHPAQARSGITGLQPRARACVGLSCSAQ
ncbi:LysR family transcriptional regulator [Pseudomonas sp. URMO17WK12:I11]|uniref:LysR family transcriptional regulator n=1 Tax=Pseudomonas sp. URMO17WK12:I11 TaxID=1283291 RepID=UPI00119EDBEB